jgi:mRNA interferase RelE/StbE
MAWIFEFDPAAQKSLKKLDPQIAKRILHFLRERVGRLDDPRQLGAALQGPELGKYWKYRVGDYRVICRFINQRVVVVVLHIGHRREVYR